MKSQHHRHRLYACCFFLCVFLSVSLTSLWIHQNRGILNWRSEIWADKAGYYMYLPALFLHGFNTSGFPDKIDEKTGWGFSLDHEKNRILTQYYYGVSLLVSPFFLGTHLIAVIAGHDEMGGFSKWYHRCVDIAGAFYLTLGLLFLKRFLRHYFRERMQYFILIAAFLGTNLFYYTVEDTLMSHVYSFFAVSLFLYSMKEFLLDRNHYRYFLLAVISLGLILAIRPINLIIAFLFLFWDADNCNETATRIKLLLHPKFILPLLLILLLFLFPQMLYWKHTHGSWLFLKYGEKFVNWNQPKIAQVWFSTLNGLFTWSPLVLLFVSGVLVMILQKNRNGIIILILFLLITYMAAAYRYWHFGCGFGHRAFVEFYPVLAIPFGFLSVSVFTRRTFILKTLFVIVVVLFMYISTGLALTTDKCFFGSSWDWQRYTMMLNRIHLAPRSHSPYIFQNDFENSALFESNFVTDSVGNSGRWSTVLDQNHETCCRHTQYSWDFGGALPDHIRVEASVQKTNAGPTGAFLVCELTGADTVYYTQRHCLDPFLNKVHDWASVQTTFNIPVQLPGDAAITVFIDNPAKQFFFVDDLVIRYYTTP